MSSFSRPSCNGRTSKDALKETERTANNMEEKMKYRDAAYSKAQREKLHNDFLNFYNNEFFPNQRDSRYKSPSKACFHKKGQEYLDSVSENRYLSYSVSSRK